MISSLWKKPAFLFPALCVAGVVAFSPLLLRLFGNAGEAPTKSPAKVEKPYCPLCESPTRQAVLIVKAEQQVGDAKPGPTAFAFPDDASGKQLAQKLPPAAQEKLPTLPPTIPLPRVIPPAVKNPSPAATLVKLPIPKLAPGGPPAILKPAAVPEDVPLAHYSATPVVPEITTLAVNPAISVPSADVKTPPILVHVKQPTPDAASLADPTQEASQQAALAATPAPRAEAAPFLRLSLPDPFANRKTTDLFDATAEEATPITTNPAIPGP